MSKDYRIKETIQKEDDFICSLRKNETLYVLANELLFRYVQLALPVLSKREILEIVNISLLTNKPNPSKNGRLETNKYTRKIPVILRNGLKNGTYLFRVKSVQELIEYHRMHQISLLQITSAFYRFQVNNKLLVYYYKKDPVLRKRITDAFNTYFVTEHTFEEIDKIVQKSKGGWFYTWLLAFLESKVKNLFHRNSNEDTVYVRTWVTDLKMKDLVTIPQSEIHCVDKPYPYEYDVVKGNSYMKPSVNSVFWNVMKENKKHIFAGFSSSATLCYHTIFNITHILSDTKKNKVLLLCLILADYYEIHHSISEVLAFYTSEAGWNYKLSDNDMDYLSTLLASVNFK